MRILYGVQTTGNGHISRSRELIRTLKQRGHDIQVVFSGNFPERACGDKIFEPAVVHNGIGFVVKQGKVDFVESVRRANFLQLYEDILSFDLTSFDLVISDFEPVSARAAKLNSVPCIGISHPIAIMYDIPMPASHLTAAIRFFYKHYAPVDRAIGVHWHHFNAPIIPPLVPQTLRPKPTIPDKVLVYLPFEDQAEVADCLRPVSSHQFYIYHADTPYAYQVDNLAYRPESRSAFLGDLADCSGVICNAGFQLPSEALHLGKKILAKPLHNSSDQESNALILAKLNLGRAVSELSKNNIVDWLQTPAQVQIHFPDVAAHLADWLERGHWDDLDTLLDPVWANVYNNPLTWAYSKNSVIPELY